LNQLADAWLNVTGKDGNNFTSTSLTVIIRKKDGGGGWSQEGQTTLAVGLSDGTGAWSLAQLFLSVSIAPQKGDVYQIEVDADTTNLGTTTFTYAGSSNSPSSPSPTPNSNGNGASASSTIPTTHLCTAAHYSASRGCLQDDHVMNANDVALAYIVTDIPVSYNDVSGYHIFQPQSDGTTNEVAIKAADMSSEGSVFKTRLDDIWSAQGAATTPGTYDFVTEYGVGDTLHYKLVVTSTTTPLNNPTKAASTGEPALLPGCLVVMLGENATVEVVGPTQDDTCSSIISYANDNGGYEFSYHLRLGYNVNPATDPNMTVEPTICQYSINGNHVKVQDSTATGRYGHSLCDQLSNEFSTAMHQP